MWAQVILDRVKLVSRGPRASPGEHLGEPIGGRCVGEGRDETSQIAVVVMAFDVLGKCRDGPREFKLGTEVYLKLRKDQSAILKKQYVCVSAAGDLFTVQEGTETVHGDVMQ